MTSKPISPYPRIAAVCGLKNSGKTTLLSHLIRCLTARGLRVAAIKHDGHDFACDIPGTDSWRFAQAGAYGTAVYSGSRMFIHRQGTGETDMELIRQFPEADVILLEGGKDSAWPKIEVIRKEISSEPVSRQEDRFLIVTDWPPEMFTEDTLPFDAAEEIADRLLAHAVLAEGIETGR